jgi:hypothetical protein
MQIKIVQIFLSSLVLGLSCLIAELDTIDVRFIGIETMRSDLYVQQGDEFEEVMIPMYERSTNYKIEVNERFLKLYTKTETEEGPVFEIAAEGKLPTGAESALGVYLVSPNGKPQLFFYSNDWSDFPKRSYRLINISPVVISSKIDESIIQVDPFQAEIVKVGSKSKIPSVSVITVYKDSQDEWRPIYDQRVPLRPDWRSTGIVVVTDGRLLEVLNPEYKVDRSKPVESTLNYFSFTDDAYTSAQKVAQRQQAGKSD